jgi:hypothetical protein
MNIKKKLQNPFVLVGQGFVVGAILFFATTPPEEAPQLPVQSAAVPKIAQA